MLVAGDIVFVRGHWDSIVDDLIKSGEAMLEHDEGKSLEHEYSHCAVYIGKGRILEAQGFRRSGEGFLSVYAGDYDRGAIHFASSDQRDQFIAALNAENGLKYDWRYIFWVSVMILVRTFLKGAFRKHRAWFIGKLKEHSERVCCTYIGRALKKVGITVDDTTPTTLANSKPEIEIEMGPRTLWQGW